ncbi:MAG TPA: DUF2336 domain-containing protein [Hyphomonadaceae bacterium]|nr:DUF2336 domain-containing protein [Hyphomonadaceae bacterium]
MAERPSNFSLLVELAKETSSEKRRELLRQVTDVFLVESQTRSDREAELFDEIVGAVAADLETQVRIELAQKVAASRLAIRRTARRLAFDDIEVARPVLEKSTALTQSDLVDVIQQTSQDHMMAVTKRPDIGERTASALVARGEDPVVASLLSNPLARISRETYERVAHRALTSPVLHAPFVRRMNVPLDLLNEVYLKVSADLRREIVGKFQGATDVDVQAALESSREHLSSAYGALPADYQLAKQDVDDLQKRDVLRPSSLEAMLRGNKHTSFVIAFARLTDVDFDLASRLIEAKDVDAMALLCRAAEFERNLFVTLCMMMLGGSGGLSKAERYGQLYEQVPVVAARRALRFWKVRAKVAAEKGKAAA